MSHPHAGRDIGTALMIGILAGVLGLLPWLATGAQLPVQNLWALDTPPADMPLALLPLSQYELITLVALLTTGGAAAGLAVRVWFARQNSPARRRSLTWWAAAGVLLVQTVATVQSFTVLHNGLAPRGLPLDGQSSIYFGGLLAGVIATIIAGIVALLLLSAGSVGVAALGVGLMAVPFGNWISSWFDVFAGPGNIPSPVLSLMHWLPAVMVGAALAWCGFRPAGRLAVWAANLGLLWVIPALFISVQYAFGTRNTLGDFQEMALMGRQILTATLGPAGGAGPRIALALAIGLLGAGVMELLRRRRLGKVPAQS